MPRYILEGEWSGYTSSQQRIVHRETIGRARFERLKALHKIVYTDGTALYVTVREAQPGERVMVRDSYGALIREAEASGKSVFRVGVDDKAAA
jgi:hypothetical protein